MRALALFLCIAGLGLPGCTPALVIRAQKGDLRGAKLLLAKPVDQETKDEALLESILAHHDEVVGLLLDNGANPEAKNELGASALALAVMRNESSSVQSLLEHKAQIATAVECLKYAGLSVAQLLLDHGLDPAIKDSKGATGLAYAACDGHADLVKLWLDRGVDPAKAGIACEHSHFDIESVNMICDDTATALDCARAKGYGEIARLLEAAMKK